MILMYMYDFTFGGHVQHFVHRYSFCKLYKNCFCKVSFFRIRTYLQAHKGSCFLITIKTGHHYDTTLIFFIIGEYKNHNFILLTYMYTYVSFHSSSQYPCWADGVCHQRDLPSRLPMHSDWISRSFHLMVQSRHRWWWNGQLWWTVGCNNEQFYAITVWCLSSYRRSHFVWHNGWWLWRVPL